MQDTIRKTIDELSEPILAECPKKNDAQLSEES